MIKVLNKKISILGIIIIFLLGSILSNTVVGSSTYFYTQQDFPVSNGGIIGSHTDTHTCNEIYEEIKEIATEGLPKKIYSYLEHKWCFELSGTFSSIDFYLEAYHTGNAEGDDFVFAYSTNDVDYNNLLTVTKTSDDNNYQTASMSNTLTGTIYIRVKDLDRSKGNSFLDTIYIDHMYIEALPVNDATPPIISDVTSLVDDNIWYNMNPAGSIPARERFGMAYDSTNDRSIVFGGLYGGSNHNDTWLYNFNDNIWYNANPNIQDGTLYSRSDFGIAYDSFYDRTVLFGGCFSPNSGDELNDTWVYNYSDNTWYNMNPEVSGGTLTKRSGHVMTYNSNEKLVIMFGGWGAETGFLNETWAYNCSDNTWYKLSTIDCGGSLPRLAVPMLGYDSVNNVMVLFGGQYQSTFYNETWVFHYGNKTWVKKNPSFIGGTLTGRRDGGMAYDPNAERIILFGGDDANNDEFNDTWVYNVSEDTWYNVNYVEVGGILWPREACRIVYDSSAGGIILFGGFEDEDLSDGPYLNDTWILNLDDYSATIKWTTDEPSNSVVNYGTTTALGNTESDLALVINHKILITDLLPNTIYYYELQSTDASNNTAIDNNNGNYYTFSTIPDTTPPIISNIQTSDITHNSATITWNTDENSNSRINYGTTINLGNTEFDPTFVTDHAVVLADLLPEMTYYYEVQSTDKEGNTATDDNNGSYYIFTTESSPANTMHVYSIDMWYQLIGKKYRIYTMVKIVDNNDNAVEGARVYIEITLPDTTKVTYDDITIADGFVTFMYGLTQQTGIYTSLVTNVVKDGWIYNPNANVETSETLVVP